MRSAGDSVSSPGGGGGGRRSLQQLGCSFLPWMCGDEASQRVGMPTSAGKADAMLNEVR